MAIEKKIGTKTTVTPPKVLTKTTAPKVVVETKKLATPTAKIAEEKTCATCSYKHIWGWKAIVILLSLVNFCLLLAILCYVIH